MRRFLLGLASVVGAIIALAGPAAARIPIPCTGETLVKVLDIPALNGMEVPANKHMKEKRIDLGYKFSGCSSEGEWVGHIGSSKSYIKLDGDKLQRLMDLAGLKALPPPPSPWSQAGILFPAGLWVVIIGFVGVGTIASVARRKATAAGPLPQSAADGSVPAANDAWMARAMDTAASAPRPAVAPPPVAFASRSRAARISAPRAAFGRRG